MTEILPSLKEEGEAGVEEHIGLLMQMEAAEGAVSSEPGEYRGILRKWMDGELTDEQAKEQANQVSAGRQQNHH